MLFMVRFILLVFHFLTLIFFWSVEIGMCDQKELQSTLKSLVFNWEGCYIYENNMFNEVLHLECYLHPVERDIPLWHEGRLEHDMGRKRWIWKDCLKTLLSRWLQGGFPREAGVRVFAVLRRGVLMVSLAPPVSTWIVWSSSAMLAGISLFTWGPGPQLPSWQHRYLLLSVCSTSGSPGLLQSS